MLPASLCMRTDLFIDLDHRSSQGMDASSGAPHWVRGKAVLQHREKVSPVDRLQLISVRISVILKGRK